MKRWHTREESGIVLDRLGQWWHDGERIEHPRIVEAFNRGLEPTEDGRFRLQFGWDWCFVTVEDAAYRVLRCEAVEVPQAALVLSLSNGSSERLDPTTLTCGQDDVLSCRVMGGRARARFTRQAQLDLGSLLQEKEGRLGLVIGPSWIALPGLR